MLLTRLYELSKRQADLSPPGYSKKLVSWYVDLDHQGRFKGLVPTEGTRKRSRKGRVLDVPYVDRTSGDRARFIADEAEYVFGLDTGKGRAEKTANRHSLYLQLLDHCIADIHFPSIEAIRAFCGRSDLGSIDELKQIKSGERLLFRVGESLVIDEPAIQSWWASQAADYCKPAEGTCMVTASRGMVVTVLPEPITGIPGDQGKYYLCSVNAGAFESYGLAASLNAPMSFDAAERIGKVLNWLLASDRHSLRVGGVAYVFWTREPAEINALNFLTTPDSTQVRELIRSVFKDAGAATVQEQAVAANDFYAAALTASGSRVVVRDWVETTVANVQRNFARWFLRQDLCNPYGKPGQPLGIFSLIASLFRDAQKENPKLVARFAADMVHVALTGGLIPDYIMSQAIRRNVLDHTTLSGKQGREYAFAQHRIEIQARMIKLWLASQKEHDYRQENYMVEIELTNHDPAYLCGRMLAVLERIQQLAVPGAKATLLDRYYGTASSAPASIFGTLLRGAQPHLAKLRKTRPGAYSALSQRLEQIIEHLPLFPKTLSLKQQALFSLGYYHQRAYDRAQAKARRELKDLEPDTTIPEKEA